MDRIVGSQGVGDPGPRLSPSDVPTKDPRTPRGPGREWGRESELDSRGLGGPFGDPSDVRGEGSKRFWLLRKRSSRSPKSPGDDPQVGCPLPPSGSLHVDDSGTTVPNPVFTVDQR